MCKPASFIVTKDRAYWSKFTDSHSEIIEEHKLHADGVRGPNIAKVEICPPNEDYRLPLDQWMFKLDEDVQPKWYNPQVIEAMVREALPEWVAAKIVLPGQQREVWNGVILVCYGTVKAYGSSTVTAYDSSTVKAYGSSTVTAYDSSTVTAYGSSTVTAYDSSTVTACNSSTVKAYGSSTVIGYRPLARTILTEPNAVLIDRSGPAPVCYVGPEETK